MPSEELKDFVEERLRAYDPDIDLTEGSPAQDQVVDPIVNRFEPDPFEMDLLLFLQTRLQQEFPNTNFREGSGIYDLLVKANQILMDPISREVTLIKQGQSLANPDLLAESEVDALVANLFVNRTTGGLSTGTVRLYFNAPVALNISVGNVCYTSGGLRYLPTTLQSISAEAMVFNQSGNLYYFDIQVTAEKAGSEYNIDKEEIVGITNLNAAVRVTNPERFEDGLDEETNDEVVEKAEESVTERSLVVGRGVSTRLQNEFESLVHLQVVGMFDEEMGRDVITGGDLGPILLDGADGYTEDDDDGDSETLYFKVRHGTLPQDPFLSFFGAAGSTDDEYYLTYSETKYGTDGEVPSANLDHFKSATAQFKSTDVGSAIITLDALAGNIGLAVITAYVGIGEVEIDRVGVVEAPGITWFLLRRAVDVQIDSVIGAKELKLKTAIPVDMEVLTWAVRKKILTLSDIPGGIIFSDDAAGLEVRSDEIHIGGAADFYVRGTSVEDAELVLPAIADETPLASGLNLKGEVDDPTNPDHKEFVYVTGKDWPDLGVKPGYSLVIESGVNAGTKTVLRTGIKPATMGGFSQEYLQIDPPLTSTDLAMRYKIVDDIDINLREPRVMRGEGTDLQTIQLSAQVTTASAVDFLALGAEEDDTLRLLDGQDEGDYNVESITGVGNKNLELGAQMRSTANNISWELFKAYDGLDFPLVRITSVELLDSSDQPTGDIIPYADPVDARTTAFSNAGRGTKVSTSDAILGIVGTVDLDGLTYPLTACVLAVSVNGGSAQVITLTGSTNKTDVINKINAVVFNIGGYIDVDGESRLTIRSGDRWLRVLPEASSSSYDLGLVGLDALGEDNRQIKSLNNIADWTSSAYDLKPVKDVVYVRTGDNIGYLYLVAVESSPNRLLAVGFDEEAGRVRFLHPNTNISIAAGSRSYGKARLYFLDPTSITVHGAWRPALKNTTEIPANAAIEAAGGTIVADESPRSYFTAEIEGTQLRFFPDPDLKRQVLPSTSEDVPNNLTTDGTTQVQSDDSPGGTLGKNSRDSEIDFLLREVQVNDLLEVNYQPIQGTVDVRDTSAGGAIDYGNATHPLAGKTLIMSIDGALPRTITLTDQIEDEDDLVDEINSGFGVSDLVDLEEISSAKYLRFEGDFEFTLHGNGTANTVLGLGTSTVDNDADAKPANVYYTILGVGHPSDLEEHGYLVLDATAAAGQAQHFKVWRQGDQRIYTTDMQNNLENGLYYVDVELVSEGVGDDWNLAPGELMEVSGHESDGYRLAVVDSNLSYSIEEELVMSISRRILTAGSTDRPDQATLLSGQNIQVNYERSPLTSSIQSFASSQLERVLCASLLVRHLQPHYLNFELTYRGGSSADIVEGDVQDYLDGLGPDDRVESSDLTDLARRRGSDYVQHPLELVAVVHDEERKISVDRSENYVTKGRLATFFEGEISVTREESTVL